ncbi:MAG: hypothetical protein IGQ88_12565 [Gloeomargaritaceae cyanobacterium C42_A2020_066]|nr:hypothetical protein [Gloeomargaritaceae cyanobacterium C42_A2020_066]
MDANLLPAEVLLSSSQEVLGHVYLERLPQPGGRVDLGQQSYLVLERHHYYQFRAGRYRLQRVALHVQSAPHLQEKSWVQNRWVIGDAACRFNACSELLRCAVNPAGPCQGCRFFEAHPPD